MGDAGAPGHEFRAGWWNAPRLVGAMYATFGAGGLVALGVLDARGTPLTAFYLGVVVLWAAGGAALLLVAARVPRRVRADRRGLELDRGRARSVAWSDLVRVRRLPSAQRESDAWLETTTGRLVRLPHGVPAGTVEQWRAELGAPPGAPGQARASWPRPSMGPAGETQLAQALLWPYLVSSLLADDSVVVLTATALLAAAAAATALLLPRRPVTVGPGGITVPHRLRWTTVPWDDVADVRPSPGTPASSSVLVRADGTRVRLPVGLTPDVVEGWRREHART